MRLRRHQIRTVLISLCSLKLIPALTNKTAAAALQHDLNNPTNMTMTSIDATTWGEIRTYFGIPNPNCTTVTIGGVATIPQADLSCLNVLWKYFVPLNGCT